MELGGGVSFRVSRNGILKIGKNCFINKGSSINCVDKISIGDNVIIGENVKFYDHNHNFRDKDKLIQEQGLNFKPVIIENNCWIGSNVTILKGVRIGTGSVIGAGCIIYKDIPEFSVVKSEQKLEIEFR